MARHLGAPLVHVAGLEEVDDAPVAGLQLEHRVGGRLSGRDHVVGHDAAVGQPIRPPQSDVARVEGHGHRPRVSRAARRGHCLGAERIGAVA